MSSTDSDLAVTLLRLANGYQVSQAIAAAAALGLADVIDAEPRAVDEIGARVDADGGALYRLLRALTTIGIFRENEEHRFTATAMSELLRSDHPRSLRAWPEFVRREYHWVAWGDLLNSVRTGDCAMQHIYRKDVWQFRADKHEETTIFNAAMSALARSSIRAIVDAYDFDRFDRIVDVGGGTGTLLTEILSVYPRPGVMVIETVIGARNEGAPAAFSDLNMLVATGGRVRGRDDWWGLLTDTGFDQVDVKPTESRFSLIEGRATGAHL